MDAYSTANWALAFSATAGASAALTGLLFVALSINLKQVVASPGLVGRAVEALALLSSALLISILMLMPSQPVQAAAIETLSLAVVVAVLLISIHRRTDRRALGLSRRTFAIRIAGAQSGPVFLVIGAVSLLAQNGGGLYWVVPALLATMIDAIIGAWVMLVEVARTGPN